MKSAEVRQQATAGGPFAGARAAFIAVIVFCALIFSVFWQVRTFGFINLDDGEYVYRNSQVLEGLTFKGVVWAFSDFRVSNWHPLTWLSHMLDVQIFGLRPGLHHLVSVLFHLVNTCLLMLFLRTITGSVYRSAAVAALFAVHPLHVESVAWISERKDLLSTLFFLVSLQFYAGYARTRLYRYYAASLLVFGLGLLSKPMVVMLPVVLILLDFWPLARMARADADSSQSVPLKRILAEKAPFFALAGCMSVITFLAQSAGGGASAMSPIALWPRCANAITSYAGYLYKTVWPTSLASFYPHPATIMPDIQLFQVSAAAVLLVAISMFLIRVRRNYPFALWGWLWYLFTLLPVIGFIQVGGQSMADRYTYIPLIGIFVAFVWGGAAIAENLRIKRWITAGAFGALTISLAAAAQVQAGYWRDSVTLHERSVNVTERNWKAWQGLCDAKMEIGRFEQAAAACRESIAILPTFPEAWQTLGVVIARSGDHAAAIEYFQRALELRPDYFNAYKNLGSAAGNLGDFTKAAAYFREALRIRSDDPDAWFLLGIALLKSGDRLGALGAYDRLRQIDGAKAGELLKKIH